MDEELKEQLDRLDRIEKKIDELLNSPQTIDAYGKHMHNGTYFCDCGRRMVIVGDEWHCPDELPEE